MAGSSIVKADHIVSLGLGSAAFLGIHQSGTAKSFKNFGNMKMISEVKGG